MTTALPRRAGPTIAAERDLRPFRARPRRSHAGDDLRGAKGHWSSTPGPLGPTARAARHRRSAHDDHARCSVLESVPAAAERAAIALRGGGHRIHRCYEPGERGFPCKGVRDPAACPLEAGVDVAVLVRPRVAPRPTALETGVSCALRAGIPLVEQGREALDPFAPWVAARVGDGPTGADGGLVDAWAGCRDRPARWPPQ